MLISIEDNIITITMTDDTLSEILKEANGAFLSPEDYIENIWELGREAINS